MDHGRAPAEGAGGKDAHDKDAHQSGAHKHKHAHPHKPSAGPGAPLWMLSFADMMTNLLCFFILLSAFAQKQEGVLLEDGLGSIQKALLSVKMPGTLEGRTNPMQFNAGRVVHRSASTVNQKTLVEADGRILDANRDTLRKVVAETLSARGAATLPTPLLFEADSTALTAGHRAFLDEVARYVSAGSWSLRIDGYSFEEGSGEGADGWRISEERARAARDHLTRAGIGSSRIVWVGHGMLRWGAGTKAGAPASAQNQYGRRAVLVTFLD